MFARLLQDQTSKVRKSCSPYFVAGFVAHKPLYVLATGCAGHFCWKSRGQRGIRNDPISYCSPRSRRRIDQRRQIDAIRYFEQKIEQVAGEYHRVEEFIRR